MKSISGPINILTVLCNKYNTCMPTCITISVVITDHILSRECNYMNCGCALTA